MTAKLFSLSNRLQHRLSGPHNGGTDDANDIDIWFATQITTSKWFSMNTKTGIYIICTTRTTMQVVLDRARVSRLCRSLYGVRTHNTTRLCHMTSNNLSTRIFGTGFSFLSLSLSPPFNPAWIFCLSSRLQDERTFSKFQRRVIPRCCHENNCQ